MGGCGLGRALFGWKCAQVAGMGSFGQEIFRRRCSVDIGRGRRIKGERWLVYAGAHGLRVVDGFQISDLFVAANPPLLVQLRACRACGSGSRIC